ncbi:MAG TPA: hypothetical protein VGD50_01155, partial [Candidatus Baltobacteraceae bacterium]
MASDIDPISLDDTYRWADLRHAYGSAADIPNLLRRLEAFPVQGEGEEIWPSLWSSLAHQGDVYPASFAAVPHVIQALSADPLRADYNYFGFPAWVEICRQQKAVPNPPDLCPAYFAALARLPHLVAAAAD